MTNCHLCGKSVEEGYTVSNCVEICGGCHEENHPAIEAGYFDWEGLLVELDFEKALDKLLNVYA